MYRPRLCNGILLSAFWLPVVGLALGTLVARCLSAAALGGMMLSYLPILRFYGISTWWALTVPVIGTPYVGMTWTSVIR